MRRRRRRLGLVALFGLTLAALPAFGLCSAALAQSFEIGIFNQTDPGQIEKRIRQRERERPPPTEAPDLLLPEEPGRALPEEEEAATFRLTSVSIEGASVFEPEALAPLYAEFLGRDLGLADVEVILARITERYRDDGYILARALAPPQDLEGGVLRVTVVEGFIESVVFEGAEPERWGLAAYARRLTDARPLNLRDLERAVLLMNDLPGLAVSPSLRALDPEAGSHELIVGLEPDRLDGTLYGDNRGTPDIGRLQAWASAGANATLGLAERLQLGFFTVPNQPRELLFLEGSYEQPLGSDGLALTLSASGSRAEPDGIQRRIDTKSHSRVVTAQLRYPAVRARDLNLWLLGRFEYRNQREERLAVETLKDRLRVLRGRVDLSFLDGLEGANFLGLEVSRGLDVLGASGAGDPTRSRIDGEPGFTKLTLSVTRRQPLPLDGLTLQLTGDGQYAFDPLLSSEEISLGGSSYGRAYDFSEVTGEHGLAGSLELGYELPLESDWLPSLEVYGFYDLGAVWDEALGDGTRRESLSSAGGGLRLTLFGDVQAGVELAKPLTRRVATRDSKGLRAFFFISAAL